jgi:large subunit ribosomal protein L17
MRHNIAGRKLNRTSSHRKSMLANMAVALVTHEQIKTTLPKAKELRRYVEKLVTVARKGDLSSRRKIISTVKDELAAEKLISVLAPRYKERPGGYTRIVKAGFRYGDVAPVAYIEFVGRDEAAKGSKLEKASFVKTDPKEEVKPVKTKKTEEVSEEKPKAKTKKKTDE